jgi:cytidine deaminase
MKKAVMIPKKLPKNLHPLFLEALNAHENAYAPHSGCQVGAALFNTSGEIFSGCNVENSSYGGTVCAERGAVQTAIRVNGSLQIKALVVVTEATPPWPPCGLCRQVLSEFLGSTKDFPIYSCNLQGMSEKFTFKKLYPASFTPNELKRIKKK